MNIDFPLKHLGSVDIAELRDVVLSLDQSAWDLQKHRQEVHRVHSQTESIVLLFTEGEGWPNIVITQDSGWEMLAEAAMPIIQKILAQHYPPGGTIIRAMAAKLPADCIIRSHVDEDPSFRAGHRIHVPLTTNHRVRFMIDGQAYQFEVGQAYEINNQKFHSVMNKGREDRITLIFDYVPPDKALNSTMVRYGEAHRE